MTEVEVQSIVQRQTKSWFLAAQRNEGFSFGLTLPERVA